MKQHPTYEHLMISDQGEVFSKKTNKFLKLHTTKTGYKTFSTRLFGRNGSCICLRVHRLVAESYLPNPNYLPMVNHKDGNKQNNSVDNLEWCTNQQNVLHAYQIGLNIPRRKEQNHIYKGSSENVKLAADLRIVGWTFRKIADLFAVDHVTIIYWLKNCVE